jgi:hypothetical protein
MSAMPGSAVVLTTFVLRQHAVVSDQVESRRRHEGGQFLQ